MLHVVLVIIVVGLLLWLANTYVPMAPPVKNILNVVVVICLILWLLNVFGLFASANIPVPRIPR